MTKQYAQPEWVDPSKWYGQVKVTVWNFESTALVNPRISFRIHPNQNVQNVYGLVFGPPVDNVVTGYLVPERSIVPAHRGTQVFTIGISVSTSRAKQGNNDTPGPLPYEFKLNDQPADVPVDTNPPSVPTGLRLDAVGPKQAAISWDPSTDDVGVRGYNVHYGAEEPQWAQDGTTVLSGLTPLTDYTVRVEAVDLPGNRSGRSQPLDFATTDKLPDGGPWGLPRGPFVDYMAWPNPKLAEYSEESGVDGFMLGFLVANTHKRLAWGGQDKAEFDACMGSYGKEDIAAFREAGGKVAFSCGGASGQPIEAVIENVSEIVGIYDGFIRNYEVTHLDFDFEGDFLAHKDALKRHVMAVVKVLENHPGLRISYTLPADAQPSTGSAGFSPIGVQFLGLVAAAGIEPGLINGMLMEFGQAAPPDMYECCVIGLEAMYAQIHSLWRDWDEAKVWNRIGATPMFGCNINKRVFTLDDMHKLVDFAHEHHIGLLSGWDATRDHNQGDPAVQPPCGAGCDQCDTYRCTCVDQKPFAFSQLIALYKNGGGER